MSFTPPAEVLNSHKCNIISVGISILNFLKLSEDFRSMVSTNKYIGYNVLRALITENKTTIRFSHQFFFASNFHLAALFPVFSELAFSIDLYNIFDFILKIAGVACVSECSYL